MAQALSTLAGDIETEETEMGGDMAQDGDDGDDEDGLADVLQTQLLLCGWMGRGMD